MATRCDHSPVSTFLIMRPLHVVHLPSAETKPARRQRPSRMQQPRRNSALFYFSFSFSGKRPIRRPIRMMTDPKKSGIMMMMNLLIIRSSILYRFDYTLQNPHCTTTTRPSRSDSRPPYYMKYFLISSAYIYYKNRSVQTNCPVSFHPRE